MRSHSTHRQQRLPRRQPAPARARRRASPGRMEGGGGGGTESESRRTPAHLGAHSSHPPPPQARSSQLSHPGATREGAGAGGTRGGRPLRAPPSPRSLPGGRRQRGRGMEGKRCPAAAPQAARGRRRRGGWRDEARSAPLPTPPRAVGTRGEPPAYCGLLG